MTREEAIENIKLIRFNAAITNANSFKEALDMAIEALSKPELPSNLDEAANSYSSKTECAVVACRGFKAEALKDLPRWKKIGRGNNYSSETKFTINGRYLEMNDTLNDVYEVPLSALEKLPRFKED